MAEATLMTGTLESTRPAAPLAGERRVSGGLPGLCEDVFSLIIHLRTTGDFGDQAYDSFRRKVTDLFSTLEPRGRQMNMDSEDLSEATYALAAFVDETILNSKWIFRDMWETDSLQLKYFKTHLAGEIFFEKLEQVRRQALVKLDQVRRDSASPNDPVVRQMQAKADLLEVYYLCLLLGFEGQFKILGLDKLRALMDGVGADMGRLRASAAAQLSSSWKPEAVERRRDGFPRWVWLAGAAAVLLALVFYIVLRFWIGSHAGGVISGFQR